MNITESNSAWHRIEHMSVDEILHHINEEDAKVHLAVRSQIPKIKLLIEKLIKRVQKGGRLFYIGAGTSGRLGILDASEIPPTFGMPEGVVIGLIAGGDQAIRKAVEAAEDHPNQAWIDLQKFRVNPKDTIVGIAASGNTPYVLGALSKANRNGLLTACITCNPDTKLAQIAQIAIEPIVGPEFITGSTRMKAGTAQKMVLNMISTALMIKLGRIKDNKMIDMQLTNQKLIERGIRIISEEMGIDHDEARRLLLLHGSVRAVLEYLSH